MADSATPKPAERPCVAVAYSGGLDSTALLWLTARQGILLGASVVALHVHHGLMPEADAWTVHAQRAVDRLCAQGLPVRLLTRRLSGSPSTGDSVEAWARRGRYTALAEMAHEAHASLVLLAQHADDQAETVLLQALRGAGPAGLAAMPAKWNAHGVTWARPWLQHRRAQLRAAAEASGLDWVEDRSNSDPRFARSRLRQQVMPALEQAFPQSTVVLSDVARHASQARALAEEVAQLDLPACCNDQGDMVYRLWKELPPARRRNAMQAWLAQQLPDGVSVALVERVLNEWSGQGGLWPAPGAWLLSKKGVMKLEPSLNTK
jgi:tRNA(Ile)-lysidine synthase